MERNETNLIHTEPRPGDIIFVDRGLYRHYGIYIGNKTTVHFSGGTGSEISASKACIRKTPLREFSAGCKVQIETEHGNPLSRRRTVMRALNAVGSGKGKYSLVFNNCEHFANWCRYGERKSAQVDNFFSALAGAALISTLATVASLTDEIGKTI